MGRGRGDQAREYLERESAALVAKAAQGETIPADQVEALNRMARLIEIRDAAAPRRRTWWPVAAFAGALTIISALIFARVGETDVEVDLLATEVRFAVPGDEAISGALRVDSIGASGLREIRIPSAVRPDGDTVVSDAGGMAAVRIDAGAQAKHPGTITLAPLVLPAGAEASLRVGESPREYVLSVRAPGRDLRADIEGAVSVGVAGSAPRLLEFAAPKPIVLRPGASDVDLALEFAAIPQTPFVPQLAAQKLSFARVDEFTDGSRSLARRVSTILSGTLFMESLDGEKRQLRAGEELEFEESNGELRAISMEDKQIAVRYHGRVRGMTTGSGEGHRSLMPTYLEWMRARHGLSLFWGATLYLMGLIAGAMRWWGIRI